ncbi:bifunctional folylpolyglutamate synthase/dihydrofolate synthase [Sporanaerobium hydrogeniformans]|uniref:Bifunctional folylpolyglutamate synthase/dihydrofolate synthase n=1 Tax=Sporanaerobium hydrogeniformans TaxID=3072179 RepID=A0AC61DAT1_9FIRM|nr:folylpolyglutamate synthase/dihydrofolate synthase family protein [Sporanaerobium hydrogeniformans]PHV69895.1 bifunctional folylpolyglutamate synthase/dihydrofolate synthase [Sporanaerobium hydrogeniformans]
MSKIAAQSYLESLGSFGVKLGLENMVAVMGLLGNPQDKLQIIHVAGTNGKGSVTQFIKSILKEGGYKVGTFTSPHLVTLHERICINDEMISDEKLWLCMDKVRRANQKAKNYGYDALGYFEALTATAFLYFLEEDVDFVVLEVGLGGRFDATNVISKSLLSIITPIAIDHKEILGDTLPQIAREKAGIIKQRGCVVVWAQTSDVMQVFEETCKERLATLYCLESSELQEVTLNEEGTHFKWQGEPYDLQMIGIHQAHNAGLAIKAIEILKDKKIITIKREQLKKGLQAAKWQGRFEKVMNQPDFYVDGAHNVDGIRALVNTLSHLRPCYNIGIIGILKDKEIDKMVTLVAPYFDVLIVTLPPGKRAVVLEELVEEVKKHHKEVHSQIDISEAIEEALKLSQTRLESRIVAFGSLYMIGEIYTLLEARIDEK